MSSRFHFPYKAVSIADLLSSKYWAGRPSHGPSPRIDPLYIYIYIYIHTYIYIYPHRYVCIYIYTVYSIHIFIGPPGDLALLKMAKERLRLAIRV